MKLFHIKKHFKGTWSKYINFTFDVKDGDGSLKRVKHNPTAQHLQEPHVKHSIAKLTVKKRKKERKKEKKKKKTRLQREAET